MIKLHVREPIVGKRRLRRRVRARATQRARASIYPYRSARGAFAFVRPSLVAGRRNGANRPFNAPMNQRISKNIIYNFINYVSYEMQWCYNSYMKLILSNTAHDAYRSVLDCLRRRLPEGGEHSLSPTSSRRLPKEECSRPWGSTRRSTCPSRLSRDLPRRR